MRRAVCHLPTGIRYINPSEARWVGTMIPRKPANDDTSEVQFPKEETGTIVAFSRPPPTPNFGPLVALALFDAWLEQDKKDA